MRTHHILWVDIYRRVTHALFQHRAANKITVQHAQNTVGIDHYTFLLSRIYNSTSTTSPVQLTKVANYRITNATYVRNLVIMYKQENDTENREK